MAKWWGLKLGRPAVWLTCALILVPLLCIWPGASYLPVVSLRLLICKMGIIFTIHILWGWWSLNIIRSLVNCYCYSLFLKSYTLFSYMSPFAHFIAIRQPSITRLEYPHDTVATHIHTHEWGWNYVYAIPLFLLIKITFVPDWNSLPIWIKVWQMKIFLYNVGILIWKQ